MTSPHPAGFDVTSRLGLARHCVFRDAYDEAAFAAFLADEPRLAECSRRGETRLRSFPALLLDVFCLLFKLRPALLDRSRVRPAFQVNRYLIARLAAEARVQRLRARTVLREAAAAAATASLAESLLAELAARDLADENLLFELEESLDAGEASTRRPQAVRRKRAVGWQARSGRQAGDADGPGGRRMAYDLQQRLELAAALESFRGFERLLDLAQELVDRLASDDPTGMQPTEVYEIGLGAELARLLPGELLALRAGPRRKDFLRRLLARQLLTYEVAGREGSGPLVVLVDVSHSMTGEKELLSKALAIALAQVAAERGRCVSALLFGHRAAPPWRIDFRGRRARRSEIVALAETFFGGGTDFERPLSEALEILALAGEGGGQIVLISDGLCEVDERWLSDILAAKARRRARILSVLVDSGPCSANAPARFSDRIVRWSELADPRRARAAA